MEVETVNNSLDKENIYIPLPDDVMWFERLYDDFPGIEQNIAQDETQQSGRVEESVQNRTGDKDNNRSLVVQDYHQRHHHQPHPHHQGAPSYGHQEKMKLPATALRDPNADSKIFVGSLSWETTNRDLKEAFEATIGRVLNSFVVKTKDTGKSRGFGFVVFTTPEEAARAISLTGQIVINGRKVRIVPALTADEMPGKDDYMDEYRAASAQEYEDLNANSHNVHPIHAEEQPQSVYPAEWDNRTMVQQQSHRFTEKKNYFPASIPPHTIHHQQQHQGQGWTREYVRHSSDQNRRREHTPNTKFTSYSGGTQVSNYYPRVEGEPPNAPHVYQGRNQHGNYHQRKEQSLVVRPEEVWTGYEEEASIVWQQQPHQHYHQPQQHQHIANQYNGNTPYQKYYHRDNHQQQQHQQQHYVRDQRKPYVNNRIPRNGAGGEHNPISGGEYYQQPQQQQQPYNRMRRN